jgi:hypothetical protein
MQVGPSQVEAPLSRVSISRFEIDLCRVGLEWIDAPASSSRIRFRVESYAVQQHLRAYECKGRAIERQAPKRIERPNQSNASGCNLTRCQIVISARCRTRTYLSVQDAIAVEWISSPGHRRHHAFQGQGQALFTKSTRQRCQAVCRRRRRSRLKTALKY